MQDSFFSLAGKAVLVTGASSGLGAQTAIECSKAGATLVLTARNSDRLNETMSKLHGDGHQAIIMDLLDTEQIDKFVESLPKLDGVSLCAGITKSVPVKRIQDKDINDIFMTNIIANMKLVRALLRQKKINAGASVVLISSIASHYAAMGNSIYAASKGAVNSFARVLALELASRHIRVNTIQPGIIPTRILTDRFSEEQFKVEEAKYPLGFGEPVDIANGMVFLLSDAAKWITGTSLVIDGGVTLL